MKKRIAITLTVIGAVVLLSSLVLPWMMGQLRLKLISFRYPAQDWVYFFKSWFPNFMWATVVGAVLIITGIVLLPRPRKQKTEAKPTSGNFCTSGNIWDFCTVTAFRGRHVLIRYHENGQKAKVLRSQLPPDIQIGDSLVSDESGFTKI